MAENRTGSSFKTLGSPSSLSTVRRKSSCFRIGIRATVSSICRLFRLRGLNAASKARSAPGIRDKSKAKGLIKNAITKLTTPEKSDGNEEEKHDSDTSSRKNLARQDPRDNLPLRSMGACAQEGSSSEDTEDVKQIRTSAWLEAHAKPGGSGFSRQRFRAYRESRPPRTALASDSSDDSDNDTCAKKSIHTMKKRSKEVRDQSPSSSYYVGSGASQSTGVHYTPIWEKRFGTPRGRMSQLSASDDGNDQIKYPFGEKEHFYGSSSNSQGKGEKGGRPVTFWGDEKNEIGSAFDKIKKMKAELKSFRFLPFPSPYDDSSFDDSPSAAGSAINVPPRRARDRDASESLSEGEIRRKPKLRLRKPYTGLYPDNWFGESSTTADSDDGNSAINVPPRRDRGRYVPKSSSEEEIQKRRGRVYTGLYYDDWFNESSTAVGADDGNSAANVQLMGACGQDTSSSESLSEGEIPKRRGRVYTGLYYDDWFNESSTAVGADDGNSAANVQLVGACGQDTSSSESLSEGEIPSKKQLKPHKGRSFDSWIAHYSAIDEAHDEALAGNMQQLSVAVGQRDNSPENIPDTESESSVKVKVNIQKMTANFAQMSAYLHPKKDSSGQKNSHLSPEARSESDPDDSDSDTEESEIVAGSSKMKDTKKEKGEK